MTVSWTVLYNRGAIFDMDYYVNKHMPLAAKIFGEVMVSWEVFTLPDEAPYAVETHMVYRSEEESVAIFQSEEGKVVMDDLVNFSKQPPIGLKRTIVAKGQGIA